MKDLTLAEPMSKLPKKKMCKWSKSTLEKALPLVLEQAKDAKFVCRKCGRVALKADSLCKAIDPFASAKD